MKSSLEGTVEGSGELERPTWFTGSVEKLRILRNAAVRSGVTLRPSTPPTEDEAWELVDALASALLDGGFDAGYKATPRGELIESLIDDLAVYYDADDE